jgi:ABC-type glycerol-3-phosphate transport system permease component
MSVKRKKHDKFSPITVSMLIVLSIYCFVLLFLLLWAFMQVFKHPLDFSKNLIWFPSNKAPQRGFTLINLRALIAFTQQAEWMPVGSGNVTRVSLIEVAINSIIYALGGSLVNAAVTCIMAYLTAKYAYAYSKVIYGIVIVVMVIPVVGARASEIEILTKIGLYNTRFGFLVLKAGFVGIYFLVFYETFKGMPMTYNEAAMIDGASDWYVMTRICLPLAFNVFTTVALITFIQYWNDYQMAMLYMPSYPTLAYFLFKVQHASNPIKVDGRVYKPANAPMRMTATVVLMTPILIIFIALHEKLMGNLSIGGIKG